jgi:hypothetical protein
MKALTIDDIARLKLEAYELKKTKGIKNTAALAQIAQREGHKSWEALVCTVGHGVDVRHAVRDSIHGESPERARRAAVYGKDGAK